MMKALLSERSKLNVVERITIRKSFSIFSILLKKNANNHVVVDFGKMMMMKTVILIVEYGWREFNSSKFKNARK